MTRNLGDSARLTKTFTLDDVKLFSEISKDKNPIHLEEEYAQRAGFESRIVHGMLVASLISAVVAQRLPGPGSIYLSQTLNFKSPAYIGDEVTAEVEIKDIKKDKIYTLRTRCLSKDGKTLVDGEALVLCEKL